jgi:hypothetical protein
MRNKRGSTRLHLCFHFHYYFNLLGASTLTLIVVYVFLFLWLQIPQSLRPKCFNDEQLNSMKLLEFFESIT